MPRVRAALLGLLASTSFLAACGDSGPPAPGSVTVVVVTDSAYFDYQVDSSYAEASNILATLQDQGYQTRQVGHLVGDSLRNALQGAQVLVIPEQENAEIDSALAAEHLDTTITRFVNHGGVLVMSYEFNTLNTLFGWNLDDPFVGSDVFPLQSELASGTVFAGSADTLPDNDATDAIASATLPAQAIAPWRNDSSEVPMFAVRQGSGWVIWLGWDWYDAAPVGAQDGGWLDVLKKINHF
jgi:hypothetical protein